MGLIVLLELILGKHKFSTYFHAISGALLPAGPEGIRLGFPSPKIYLTQGIP
jgi:hypothetical protein